MKDSDEPRGSFARPTRAATTRVAVALAAGVVILLTGASVASADTKTGFTFSVTCGSETTTVVSPTRPAAVGQEISSTEVFVLAVGALFAPERFPEDRIVICDIQNLTTGEDPIEDLPFLVKGAP